VQQETLFQFPTGKTMIIANISIEPHFNMLTRRSLVRPSKLSSSGKQMGKRTRIKREMTTSFLRGS
jgi:hypothetical protein